MREVTNTEAEGQEGLTDAMREVLTFAWEFKLEHGYAPSLREIMRERGWTSTNSSADVLARLQRHGWITKPSRISRAIVFTEKALGLLRPSTAPPPAALAEAYSGAPNNEETER